MDGLEFLSRHVFGLVIINNFDVKRIRTDPAETDTPLIVDANAVLSNAVAR